MNGDRALTKNVARIAAMLLWTAASVPAAHAAECDTDDTELTTQTTTGAYVWDIHFNNFVWADCNSSGHYVSAAWAFDLADRVQEIYPRHTGDWSMPQPYISSFPTFNIYVFDSDDTGKMDSNCMTIDAPRMRCAPDHKVRQLVGHEVFHSIQRRHVVNAGWDPAPGMGTRFGKWVAEGTARCLDDRYDTTLDGDATAMYHSEVNNLMTGTDKNGNPHRDRSLFDQSYRAALFWNYCCEQLGNVTTEPDNGIDFMRNYWQQIQFDIIMNQTTDAVASLRQIVGDLGGFTLPQFYHDFAICMLAREFDATALPNASRYAFVDESPAGNAGAGPYNNVGRAATHDAFAGLPQSGTEYVTVYGHTFIDLLPAPDFTGRPRCEAIGIKGESDDAIGWSLVGAAQPLTTNGAPLRAVLLSKQVGKKYARAFMSTESQELSKLGAIMVGRADNTFFDYTFDAGPVTVTIIWPTADFPGYPGPFDDAGRFSVRVVVDGPAGLKPDGLGPHSVKGLQKSDFEVTVNGLPASVHTATYVGDEYWLSVDAPNQAANGAYDLTICLCPGVGGSASATNVDAVLYGDYTINHMLVVDHSGSMAFPNDGTGSKLNAAKNAGTLYIDAVNETDRLGLVLFNGNNSECDSDAITILGLDTASSIHRSLGVIALKNAVPDGWTSIGDGLWNAQDEFDNYIPALGPTDLKFITLLSDGAQNEARFWDQTQNCGMSDLGDRVKDRFTNSDTVIHTIAFGPEANQELMEDIALFTEGFPSYNDVSDSSRGAGPGSFVNELANTYMYKLQRSRGLERLFYDERSAAANVADPFNITVNENGADQGTFFFNWATTDGVVTIELRDPSNTLITSAQADIFTTPTHKVYHVPSVAVGAWTATVTSTRNVDYIAGLLGRLRHGVQLMTRVGHVTTGGPQGTDFGRFEQGVPVTLLASLTDSGGAILGASVTATVKKPDGTFGCGSIVLRDDGTQNDGEPDDGVYGFLYTQTSQAGEFGGVINDDPANPNPGGTAGMYRVNVHATGSNSGGSNFARFDQTAFNIFEADGWDNDGDELPDSWEVYYDTMTALADADRDYDNDSVINKDELHAGTDPFDEDSDDGGESDGSELAHGRCPTDPTDDLLPCPQNVGVYDGAGDEGTDDLMPNANLLRFPVYPSYQSMRIFRADETAPTTFVLVAQPVIASPEDGLYYDANLVAGRTYFYKFQAVGAGGATSCMSRQVSGVPFPEPPPLGWITLNTDDGLTDKANVLVTLDLTTGAEQYRLSNFPITAATPALNIPVSPYVNWTLDSDAVSNGYATVYAQYINVVGTVSAASEVFTASIVIDPAGNADGDSMPNGVDPDDDNDGLDDLDEVFIHHTNAFVSDSDGDGLDDGADIDCTNPRNPDTDGDGVEDGADPSAAADLDGDGDTDLIDFKLFQICFTGPGGGPIDLSCECIDVDSDNDIDDADYEAFATNLSGP